MRNLTPTLIAAQQSGSALPYLKVVARDRIGGVRRLRFERLYDGAETDSYHAAAMPADGSLLRARVDGGTLYYQRVASPGPGSAFSQWTDLGAVADVDVALCADGTRALLFFVDADGGTLKLRESNDSGATLGPPVTVATAGAPAVWLAADVKGNGDALLLYSAGPTVYAVKRSGGAWSAPGAWPHVAASIDGIACHHDGDYNIAVAGTDAAGDAFVWTAVYGDGFSQAPDTWSALRVVEWSSGGAGVTFRAPFLSRPDTHRLTFAEKYAGSAAYARPQHTHSPATAGFAFNLWREPVPFDFESEFGLALAYGPDAVWAAAASGVWTAALDVPDLDLTKDVASAMVQDTPVGGRARIVLRNDGGRYSPPAALLTIGGELRISPGYVTDAGAEASDGPAYWIERIEHITGGGESTLVLEASDAWSLLESWRARRQHAWAAGEANVFSILVHVCSRAGLDLTADAASAAATGRYPSFTVHPGEPGLTAVRRLLHTVPDIVRVRGELTFLTEPQEGGAVDYSYGGEHPVVAGRYTAAALTPNRVQVFGDSVFGERFDWEAIVETYDRLTQVLDRNAGDVATAEARADAALRKAELDAAGGEITVAVNCGQELYDVIEVTDAPAGLQAAKRRVLGLTLRYDTKAGVYEQRLALGGV